MKMDHGELISLGLLAPGPRQLRHDPWLPSTKAGLAGMSTCGRGSSLEACDVSRSVGQASPWRCSRRSEWSIVTRPYCIVVSWLHLSIGSNAVHKCNTGEYGVRTGQFCALLDPVASFVRCWCIIHVGRLNSGITDQVRCLYLKPSILDKRKHLSVCLLGPGLAVKLLEFGNELFGRVPRDLP